LSYGEIAMKAHSRESGQALLAAAFSLIVLLGAAGLAIDMGYLRYQKRLQQSAADSAALAGAAELPFGNSGQVTTAAINDATLNGFPDGFTGPDKIYHVNVTVNPAFSFGGETAVQVQVQVTQPTFFMKIFGVPSTSINASAVAKTTNTQNCVYALDGTGNSITNDTTLSAPGCGVVDNSSLDNDGKITATSVAIHGTPFGNATFPPAVAGTAEVGDPLFRLVAQDTDGACAASTKKGDGLDGIMKGSKNSTTPTSFTLGPGTYCSGLVISDFANVTFGSGLYVITGSKATNGIQFNGAGNVTGTGVTFYIADNAGSVLINSAAGSAENMALSAQTTGALAAILFYQDRNNASPATIDGRLASTLTGALYFPSATLNLANINAAPYTITVAKDLAFTGTVNLGSNYSSLPAGSPIKNSVLVE
jgi:hypothetical protein